MTAARQLGFGVVGASAGAIISECGFYRYRLWRRWGSGPHVLWCMLNPSTADAEADDPTIRKCVGFAKRWGCEGIEVVNLFAWRATDPAHLCIPADPTGIQNDEHVAEAARTAPTIVVAWGGRPPRLPAPVFRARIDRVLALFEGRAQCLGWTHLGEPWHPLMLAYETALRPVGP
jgi:hypothetical protein